MGPKIHVLPPERLAEMQEIALRQIGRHVVIISETTGIEEISAACLIAQAAVRILESMGGPASKEYLEGMLFTLYADPIPPEEELQRLNERAMRNMQAMAEHFDLLDAEPEGSA